MLRIHNFQQLSSKLLSHKLIINTTSIIINKKNHKIFGSSRGQSQTQAARQTFTPLHLFQIFIPEQYKPLLYTISHSLSQVSSLNLNSQLQRCSSKP